MREMVKPFTQSTAGGSGFLKTNKIILTAPPRSIL